MLIGISNNQRSPNAPINENGMVNITISENLGDSNCIAITINIKNMAVSNALSSDVISSLIISLYALVALSTPFGSPTLSTKASASLLASPLYPATLSAVMETWYFLSDLVIVTALSSNDTVARSESGVLVPVTPVISIFSISLMVS